MTSSRFQTAIARFDELNAKDPNKVESAGGPAPKELHDAQAMSRWIEALYPESSETVRLAARCQHLCRWEIPRSSYPEGRTAYLKWRNDLKQYHAAKSAEVLKAVGYDNSTIEEVQKINLKKGLKTDPSVQAIEDALCLVFLEHQFESCLIKWEEEKTISILRKTWGKMSEIAHNAALELPMTESASALIKKALSA